MKVKVKTREELKEMGLYDGKNFLMADGSFLMGADGLFESTVIGQELYLKEYYDKIGSFGRSFKVIASSVQWIIPVEYIFDPEDYPEYFV
jgi:hypothetical protein